MLNRALPGILALQAVFPPLFPASEQSVIYGTDDRRSSASILDARWKAAADATVALVRKYNLQLGPTKSAMTVYTRTYGEEYGLCKDEPFYSEPTAAHCTGVLVGQDLVLTAGHCMDSPGECAGMSFVFGFVENEKGYFPGHVLRSDVYFCKRVEALRNDRQGADYAIVRLDRPVANHAPVKLNLGAPPAAGTPLVMIGHPAGLLRKIVPNGKVRTPNNGEAGAARKEYFRGTLDSYTGNSGSPVFNSDTGLLEGILVRGDQDFIERAGGSCKVSFQCPESGCEGESVTKASAFSRYLR